MPRKESGGGATLSVPEEKGFYRNKLDMAITIVAVAMGVYHLTYTQYLLQGAIEHQNTHLIFSLMLVFLTTLKRNKKYWGFILVLIILALVTTTYVRIFSTQLQLRAGSPTTADIIVGIVIVAVVLEASRQTFGPIIPSFICLGIIYVFIVPFLPSPFYHSPIPLGRIVSWLSIGLEGVYGRFIGVSANIIFLFMLFGGMLRATGVNDAILEVGKLAGRRLRSGPGQTAVVSSCLIGCVTGQAAANVALTGAFTIPLMKKVGYRPEQAGAIEAAASTGGQVMPPIMGAAVFLMSGIIGVPYVKLCGYALIPALFYFLSVGLAVQFLAMKQRISFPREQVDRKLILDKMPIFVVSLAFIVVLLVLHYPPMTAGFLGTVSVVGLSYLRKETRLSPARLIEGFRLGSIAGAQIGVVSSCLGMIASILSLTGVGYTLSNSIEAWSGGILVVALFIIMAVSILLGCGAPTLAAYALVAMVTAPMLTKIGVGLVAAHIFIFYFAVFSGVTPPVATGAVVASGIAGSSYLKTGLMACRLVFPSFLIPWLFIWNGALLGFFDDPILAVMSLGATLAMVVAVQALNFGHFLITLSLYEKVLLILSALSLIVFVVQKGYVFLAGGAILLFMVMMRQMKEKKKCEQQA